MKRNRREPAGFAGDNPAPIGRTVPKTAARVVSFSPGSTWLVEASRVTVQYQPSVHDVLVRHVATGAIEKVTIASLKPIPPSSSPLETAASQKPLEHHSPTAWSRAIEEEGLIRELVDAGDQSPAARERVCSRLGISDRQVRRKLRRYDELQTAAAFLPLKSGPVQGSSQLNPSLEALVREQIAQALKDSPDIGVDDLHLPLVSMAKALGLRPPGRSTVSRRLRAARLNTDSLPASIGLELKYRRRPVRGPHSAEAPLHIVEMDHTVADVHIVEPKSGRPIGRPVLTLLLDRSTRVVLGMLLILRRPDRWA